MRYVIGFLVIIAVVSGIVVGRLLHVDVYAEGREPPMRNNTLYLYIDSETGCHYVGPGAHGGITPRMVKGVHLCESVGKK